MTDARYSHASTGIQIAGDHAYHAVYDTVAEEWHLLRIKDGTLYRAAVFASGDEARAWVHAMSLEMTVL